MAKKTKPISYSVDELKLKFQNDSFEGIFEVLAEMSATISKQATHIDYLESMLNTLDFPTSFLEHTEGLYPQNFEFTADMYIPSHRNFHELKYDGSGKPVRWTGPGRDFNFTVYVDRSVSRTCELLLGLTPELRSADKLDCYVDNTIVESTLQPEDNMLKVIFNMPVLKENRASLIKCISPVLVQPNKKDPAVKDSRILGVRFYKLEIS